MTPPVIGPIERIKQKLDIVEEIGAVVPLKKSGKAFKGLCPFHGERTPSFYVFPESRGRGSALAASEGGDIFAFVSASRGWTSARRWIYLAERAGIAFECGLRARSDAEESAETTARKRLRALNEAAAIWFHHPALAGDRGAVRSRLPGVARRERRDAGAVAARLRARRRPAGDAICRRRAIAQRTGGGGAGARARGQSRWRTLRFLSQPGDLPDPRRARPDDWLRWARAGRRAAEVSQYAADACSSTRARRSTGSTWRARASSAATAW